MMVKLSKILEDIQLHLPPAPLEAMTFLMDIDFRDISEDEFEILQDIILRIRADCICAQDLSQTERKNYFYIMDKISKSIKISFDIRQDNLEAKEFFDNFIESVNELR